MPERIRTLAKRLADTRPVQARRRHELYEELRGLRTDLEARASAEQLYALDAALLLMEFMSRSEDVATSETLHVVAGLVATIDESQLPAAGSAPARHPLRRVSDDVTEHADLRLTQGYLLGTILLQAGVITQDTLARALQLHASSHQPLGLCLVQLGAVSQEQIQAAVAYQDRLREERATRSARPASVPQPAQPAHPAQPAQPVQPAKPAQATHPTRPTGPDLRLTSKQHEYVQSMNAQVLGEVLIRLGSITREQLTQALTVQRAASVHIGEALVETGATTWEHIKKALEVQRKLRRYAA